VEHPTNEVLKRFANVKASREERRAVAAHLLKGCPSCAEKIKAFLEPHPVAGDAYEAVLDRLQAGLGEKLEELQETPVSKAADPQGPPSHRSSPKGRGRDR
jgi:hypothetical protein